MDPYLNEAFRSYHMTRRTKILLALLSLSFAAPSLAAFAQTAEERQYLLMYFKEEELVVDRRGPASR